MATEPKATEHPLFAVGVVAWMFALVIVAGVYVPVAWALPFALVFVLLPLLGFRAAHAAATRRGPLVGLPATPAAARGWPWWVGIGLALLAAVFLVPQSVVAATALAAPAAYVIGALVGVLAFRPVRVRERPAPGWVAGVGVAVFAGAAVVAVFGMPLPLAAREALLAAGAVVAAVLHGSAVATGATARGTARSSDLEVAARSLRADRRRAAALRLAARGSLLAGVAAVSLSTYLLFAWQDANARAVLLVVVLGAPLAAFAAYRSLSHAAAARWSEA